MAIVAKWLTHRIVAPALVGSIPIYRPLCRCGGIGRRAGLKIQCPLRTYRFDPDHRYCILSTRKDIPSAFLYSARVVLFHYCE